MAYFLRLRSHGECITWDEMIVISIGLLKNWSVLFSSPTRQGKTLELKFQTLNLLVPINHNFYLIINHFIFQHKEVFGLKISCLIFFLPWLGAIFFHWAGKKLIFNRTRKKNFAKDCQKIVPSLIQIFFLGLKVEVCGVDWNSNLQVPVLNNFFLS